MELVRAAASARRQQQPHPVRPARRCWEGPATVLASPSPSRSDCRRDWQRWPPAVRARAELRVRRELFGAAAGPRPLRFSCATSALRSEIWFPVRASAVTRPGRRPGRRPADRGMGPVRSRAMLATALLERDEVDGTHLSSPVRGRRGGSGAPLRFRKPGERRAGGGQRESEADLHPSASPGIALPGPQSTTRSDSHRSLLGRVVVEREPQLVDELSHPFLESPARSATVWGSPSTLLDRGSRARRGRATGWRVWAEAPGGEPADDAASPTLETRVKRQARPRATARFMTSPMLQ